MAESRLPAARQELPPIILRELKALCELINNLAEPVGLPVPSQLQHWQQDRLDTWNRHSQSTLEEHRGACGYTPAQPCDQSRWILSTPGRETSGTNASFDERQRGLR